MAHLPVHAVVRVVIDLPYDEGRLLRLDLVPKELELLHQLVHIDLAIPLLIHPLERAPQALQLLCLLELSSLTLSPLLLIVRLCTATRACEKADKASRIARTLRTSALALLRSLADDMVPRSCALCCCDAGANRQKPTARGEISATTNLDKTTRTYSYYNKCATAVSRHAVRERDSQRT